MASTKRARPAFSPPRPGKSKTGATKKTNGTTKAVIGSKKAATTKVAKQAPKRSRYTSATESESDSQGADDTVDEEEHGDDDEDEDMQDQDQDETRTLSDDDSNDNDDGKVDDHPSSPDPDYILAEISHETSGGSSSSSTPPIPLPLIHRILHAHFAKPEKTKISKDAREVMGRYFEVFVREAIMRCAYEKSRDQHDDAQEGEDAAGTPNVGADGWLEVDDLEKVAVQLCLDF